MARKKVNEAAIAPPPVSEASVPVEKKTRKKATPVAAEKKVAVKAVKTATPRRKAAPKVEAATANSSIVNLSDAMEPARMLDAREIEQRAYLSWLERGCPEGSPQEDWYRAERELIAMVATAGK